nr:DUF1631 family protein [Alkalimarinus sediminis]
MYSVFCQLNKNKEARVASVGTITKELRIPELKYEINNNQETQEDILTICEFLAGCAKDQRLKEGETSLLKTVALQSEKFRFSPRIYNSLFLVDRLTDVFYRKANIDDQLKDILSSWRFVLAKLFIQYPRLLETEDSPVLALVDAICASQIGWSQEPKRVSLVVIDRLLDIHNALLSIESDNPEPVIALKNEWLAAQDKQNQRIAKLFERLDITEQGAASSRYATEFSCYTLKGLLDGQRLPKSIGAFLLDRWLLVIRNALLKGISREQNGESQWQSLVELTKRLVFVFSDAESKKKEHLFTQAEGLVDELAAVANQYDIEVQNEEWESIQQLLITVLQDADIDRQLVPTRAPTINFNPATLPSEEKLTEATGSWYLIKQEGGESRLRFARYFNDTNEILWLNHAGMKSMIMSYEHFQKGIAVGSIRLIKNCYLLSQVFNETLRGLSKVAQAQHEAREKARLKAEAEAEQLRLEQQQAEELKRQQEQEAARRLKEQQLEAAEKKRLEEEQITLKLISELSLGAWISVLEDGERQKYKLVVKINATDKLIFVDKMGLKKYEVKTPELMAQLIAGEVVVLSGGAEFDDTLSRVVGRLRVGK